MSRLTSKVSFSKPSMLDMLSTRPVPLSPPETELEPGLPLHEEKYESLEAQVETPVPRVRKASSIAYNSSGLTNRELRSSHKQQRWLIMVLPPPSFIREPPLLGHTLSSSPAGRFSNGILMPLFPTLYGQLTAIAREFNMPSTAGLCVYLHLQDSGTPVMTPRISDESWQILWGHFLVADERMPTLPSHGLPISGRIEFDIDLRRAKWFNTWMGHLVRDREESELMSREPSTVPTHWRGDSGASLFPTEQLLEETAFPADTNPTKTSRAAPRHLPKPLILERRDISSVKSFSKHPSRAPSTSHDPPSPDPPARHTSSKSVEPTFVPETSSPVVLEKDEPQTAKRADLDSLVLQWRECSVLDAASSALTAAGQPSLDPVNMPAGTDVELDLDDFAWSISSAGPPLESPLSPHWPEPLPSVHLQGRLEGSVCLTPSVCTSSGPPDYDWPESPVSCVSRRPSPDLGMRMLDYVCLTPTTATSWGPDDIPSPSFSEYESQYRAPSVDLGVRGMGSRPMTPSTATSWGPDDIPSPFLSESSHYRVPSVDLGVRGMGSRPVTPSTATSWGPDDLPSPSLSEDEFQYRAPSVDLGVRGRGSCPVTPSTATSWGPPESHSTYPDTPAYVRTPDAGERVFPNLKVIVQRARAPVYPYYSAWVTQPWAHVWPYQAHIHSTGRQVEILNSVPRSRSKVLLPEWPDFAALYPSDPTVEPCAVNKSQPVGLLVPAEYPSLELYPPVYPNNLDYIYPVQPQHQESMHQEKVRPAASTAPEMRDLLPEWPDFAARYPSDPMTERAAANKSQPVWLPTPAEYPFFNLYPSVYPHHLDEVYPASSQVQFMGDTYLWEVKEHTATSPGKKNSAAVSTVPNTERCGPLPEWPDFAALYPIDPTIEQTATNKCQPVQLPRAIDYPFLEIYPSAYPYNLDIYPVVASSSQWEAVDNQGSSVWLNGRGMQVKGLLPQWPDFAALYPTDPTMERVAANKCQPVQLPMSIDYPFLKIYPSVYPYNLDQLYPAAASLDLWEAIDGQGSSFQVHGLGTEVELLPEWPDFASLYPVDLNVGRAGANKLQSVALPRHEGYPFLEIYQSVYPYNLDLIYPPVLSQCENTDKYGSNLPTHVSGAQVKELLPEWPDFASLYPKDPNGERAGANKLQSMALPRHEGYSFLEIYSSVYPYNLDLIYPPVPSLNQCKTNDEDRSNILIHGSGAQVNELLPEWPDFASLYPEDPNVERAGANKSQPVALPCRECYPLIAPYPAVYPYNLLEIYPDLQAAPCVELSNMTATGSTPINHYRPLLEYPDFTGLYPSDSSTQRVGRNKSQPVALKGAGYSFLTIYSPVYPFNLAEIYGPCHTINTPVGEVVLSEPISTQLLMYSGYPTFNLYPASQGYPSFEIYPPIALQASSGITPVCVKLTSAYPAVEPYEPVYPYLVFYPQTQLIAVDECLSLRPSPTSSPDRHHSGTVLASSSSSVLRELVPSNTPMIALAPSENLFTRRKPRHTHLDLHLAVFGIQSMPELPSGMPRFTPTRKPKRTHHDLHMLVFGKLSQGDSQHVGDHVPEIPSRSASVPASTRQRSRSGTISSRPTTPVTWPVPEQADPARSTSLESDALEIAHVRFAGLPRQPSAEASILPPSKGLNGASFDRSDILTPPLGRGISRLLPSLAYNVPSAEATILLPGKSSNGASPNRPDTGHGLPPSPAYNVDRPRSINSEGALLATSTVGTEPRGHDRSKSLTDTNRFGIHRQSSVLERAKMFTLLEQGSEAPNIAANTSRSITSRPVSKLDLSKHPFA